MTVLVTGAFGFVGVNLVRHLAAAHPGEEVVATDLRMPEGAIAAALTGCANGRAATLDVTDRGAVRALLAALRPESVIHAAALTLNGPEARSAVLDVNLGGTLNVLEAAAEAGVRRVVVASSSGVYAAGPGEVRAEDDPVDPRAPYAASKLAAEAVAACYGAVAARIGSVYGPLEEPKPSRPQISAIGTLAAALADRRQVALSGREVARDWTHVEDIAAGLDALLAAPRLAHTIYNVSDGHAVTLGAVADAFVRHGLEVCWTGPEEAEIAFGPQDARPALSLARITADTGFRPRHTIETGIAALVAAANQKDGT